MEISRHLKEINISHITLHALLIPCDRPDLAKKVEEGVRDTVRIVTAMLSHNMDDNVINTKDAAKMIGGDIKKMRAHIDAAIKVGCDEFNDDEVDCPPAIPADQLIYLVATLSIKEIGCLSDDLNERIVMTQLPDFLDIGAIRSASDMRCYLFLMDYLTECLSHDDLGNVMFRLEGSGDPYVTPQRMRNFIKNNYWYNDPEELLGMFMIHHTSPKVPRVVKALFEVLTKAREVTVEMEEYYKTIAEVSKIEN